jgi:glycine C-acetyltransferase
MARHHDWMEERYQSLVESGLNWDPPTLEGASEAVSTVDGKPVIMLSANNYLNLTTHPHVVSAMVEATQKYGAGISIWMLRRKLQNSRVSKRL